MPTSPTSTPVIATADSMQMFLIDVPEDVEEIQHGTPAWAKREFIKFQEIGRMENGLVTQKQAALVLGCSPQNIADLVSRGRLTRWDILDGKYLSCRELADYATAEKLKGGRPSKIAIAAAAWHRK